MSDWDWRQHAGTKFVCEKRPAHGSNGMVTTNHPLASAAGEKEGKTVTLEIRDGRP